MALLSRFSKLLPTHIAHGAANIRDSYTRVMLMPRDRTRVSGESYHMDAIEHAIQGRQSEIHEVGQWDRSLEVRALLYIDPLNRHSKTPGATVAVNIAGHVVGYVAADEAQPWVEALSDFDAQHKVAMAKAMIYSNGDYYSVVLVCGPNNPIPSGACPEGILVNADRTIQTNGEENFQKKIADYDSGTWVWAQLRPGTIDAGKYEGEPTYEVYIPVRAAVQSGIDEAISDTHDDAQSRSSGNASILENEANDEESMDADASEDCARGQETGDQVHCEKKPGGLEHASDKAMDLITRLRKTSTTLDGKVGELTKISADKYLELFDGQAVVCAAQVEDGDTKREVRLYLP